ncbi:MAG: SAM-dependent methyltransferase [Anaerolineaceae bacterium]|nr:MAG: SAM-dependent methyltransferase [Anaerolineaceae bacterium]
MATHKSNVKRRFAAAAPDYITSPAHTDREALDIMRQLANPEADWMVLDIATGGGHTAQAFAPYVKRVIASDLTPAMLHAARQHNAHPNVTFCVADAETLPFPSNTLDCITCRIAPHHFADCYRFVLESARCLKPDGLLIVQDQRNADDEKTAAYLDAFERLRDSSHHRAYADYEWRGMFLDAGLRVEALQRLSRPAGGLTTWAQRQRCDAATIEKLHIMLHQAPPAVRQHLQPRYTGTPYADFMHAYVIIAGRKPD